MTAARAHVIADAAIVHGRTLLQRWARLRPQHAALKSPTITLSFAQLLARVDGVSDELKALAVQPGDVVAFQLPNWAEAFVLYHAVLAIDAIALPLLPALRERDLAYMLQETQASLFITPRTWRGVDHAAMARRVCGPGVRLALMQEPQETRAHQPQATGSDALQATGPNEAQTYGPLLHATGRGEARLQTMPPRPVPPAKPTTHGAAPGSLDAVCSVIFTSGTSGRPKAVLYSHRNLGIEGREMALVDRTTADDVLFVPPAIGHVSGISFGICMALHAGATVCLLPEWLPDRAVALIERERCTWTAGATPFLQGLVRAAASRPDALASLRVFRCGGASVPPELIRQARALGVDAYRSYGLSEHPTVAGRAGQPDHVCTHADGIIHPLIEVHIVDPADASRERPFGEEGEIVTRGPDCSLGYLRATDTASSRHNGWLLTGDLGTLSTDGVLRVTGRKKDIIIRKGENISARELEDVLADHPAVAEVSVVGVPDAERGELVCCVVVPRGDSAPDLPTLCRHLLDRGLPTYKLPERLALLPHLPINAGGKVRKPALQAWLAGDPTALDD